MNSEVVDKFGKTIEIGSKVVYPTRPGGKGPLQLGYGTVKIVYSDESIDLDIGTDQGGHRSQVVTVKRTDRVAVVQP